VRRLLVTCLLSALVVLDIGGPSIHALLHSLPAYAIADAQIDGPAGSSTETEDSLSPRCPLSYLPALRPIPAGRLAGPVDVPVTTPAERSEAEEATHPPASVAYHSRAPPTSS